jgi:hypothetical protein
MADLIVPVLIYKEQVLARFFKNIIKTSKNRDLCRMEVDYRNGSI